MKGLFDMSFAGMRKTHSDQLRSNVFGMCSPLKVRIDKSGDENPVKTTAETTSENTSETTSEITAETPTLNISKTYLVGLALQRLAIAIL
jgi:hypothetical protein